MRWTIHDERIVDDTRFWLAARTTGGLVDINEVERIAWIPLDEVLNYVACGEIVGAASLVGLLDVLARRQRRPVANLASTGECHVCASGEPAADGFLA